DDAAQLTNWPIERISEVVEPTTAQRPALEELRAASAKAIDMLKAGCPKDLPSIPTGRLAAMESRLQVMLAAVQTVRPALRRCYQSLSDEQKARFNAIASADDRGAAAKDQRDLTKLCDERAPVGHRPADRSHRPGGSANARTADRPRRIEGYVGQGGATAQSGVSGLSNADPDRTSRGDGEAARRHARHGEGRRACAREILQFAER